MPNVPDSLIDRAAEVTAAVFGQESERLGTTDIVFLVTFKSEDGEPLVQVFPRSIYQELVASRFREAISKPVEEGYYLAVIAPEGCLQLVHAHVELATLH